MNELVLCADRRHHGCVNVKKIFRQRAAVVAEFVSALPVFLLTIFLIINLIRISYTSSALFFALNRGARLASTGNRDGVPATVASDRAALILYRVAEEAGKFGLMIQQSDLAICPFGTPAANCGLGTANAGSLGTTLYVKAAASLNLAFFGAPFQTSAQVFMTNEQ